MALDLTASAVNGWLQELPPAVGAQLTPLDGDEDLHAQAAIKLGRLLAERGVARCFTEMTRTSQAAANLRAVMLGMEQTRRIRLLAWCAAKDLRTMRAMAEARMAGFPPPLVLPSLAGWIGGDIHVAAVVQRDLVMLAGDLATEVGLHDPETNEIWKAVSNEGV